MGAQVGLALSQGRFTAEPGGRGLAATVMVRNEGTLVDQIALRIEGLDPDWYSLSEADVRLFPDDRAAVQLTLNVPADALAKSYAFRVLATSGADPHQTATADATLEVTVVGTIELALTPTRQRGFRWARYTLRLANRGNRNELVRVVPSEENEGLRFDLPIDQVLLRPGQESLLSLRVRARKLAWTAPDQSFGFSVAAVSPQDQPAAPLAQQTGEFVRCSLPGILAGLPGGLRRAALLAAPLLLLLLLWLLTLGLPGQQEPARQAAATATAPALAAAAATQPPQQLSPTAGEAATPSPVVAVASPVARPEIVRFGLNLPAAQAPVFVPLDWDVRGASSPAQLSRTPFDTGPSRGETEIEAADYTLTATNEGGSTSQTMRIYVLRPPVITEFEASAEQVGDLVRLTWRTNRANRVFVNDRLLDGTEGTLDMAADPNGAYLLRAENAVGQDTRLAQVSVVSPSICVANFESPQLTATVNGANVDIAWSASGGCEPYTGTIKATYGYATSERTLDAASLTGSDTDTPPAGPCGSPNTITYSWTLADAQSHTASADASVSISHDCPAPVTVTPPTVRPTVPTPRCDPPESAELRAQASGANVVVTWTAHGDCGPYTGVLRADYAYARSDQSFGASSLSGSGADTPPGPTACGSANPITYTWTLRDREGHTVTATTTTSLNRNCTTVTPGPTTPVPKVPTTVTPNTVCTTQLDSAQLNANVKGDNVELTWSASGGCKPYSGSLHATDTYAGSGGRDYTVSDSSGSQVDTPPSGACGEAHQVNYTLSLRDHNGQSVSASTTASVGHPCDTPPAPAGGGGGGVVAGRPSIVGSRTPPPNAAGWNNTDVTVSFTCSDDTANITSCPTPTVLTKDGANQSVAGEAVDDQNIKATTTVDGINIDKTPPTTTATLDRKPNENGWIGRPAFPQGTTKFTVNVALSAQDQPNLSGVRSITFSAAPACSGCGGQSIAQTTVPTTANAPTATVPITAEGQTVVTYFATDVAGNSESAKTVVVRLDVTPPAATPVLSPRPDQGTGWVNSFAFGRGETPKVTVVLGAGDFAPGSGIKSITFSAQPGCAGCPGETIVSRTVPVTPGTPTTLLSTTKDGVTTITFTATDVAGNETGGQVPVKFDATPPVLTTPSDVTAFTTGNNATVTYAATATDALSSNPAFGFKAPEVKCDPPSGSTLPLGLTRVTCTATDAAGNAPSNVFAVTVNQSLH